MTDTDSQMRSRPRLRSWVQRYLYPALLLWVGGCVAYGIGHPDALTAVLVVKAGVMVPGLLLLEWLVPYRRRWGMTWRLFLRRDLVFIAINGATLGLTSFGLTALSIGVAGHMQGPMTGQPLWLQVVVGLLVFESLQYWIHRTMHTGRGPLSRWLWRTHAIHHLPQQLYLVMHAVFHPFNAIIIRLAVQLLPVWVLGYDPVAAFAFGAILALHGTVSHANLDIRAGWLNYVFVGPQLHRVHHAAEGQRAVNFAATLSLFDLVFGTLDYRPETPPRVLGLRKQDGYPGQQQPFRSLAFAFSTRPVEAMSPTTDGGSIRTPSARATEHVATPDAAHHSVR